MTKKQMTTLAWGTLIEVVPTLKTILWPDKEQNAILDKQELIELLNFVISSKAIKAEDSTKAIIMIVEMEYETLGSVHLSRIVSQHIKLGWEVLSAFLETKMITQSAKRKVADEVILRMCDRPSLIKLIELYHNSEGYLYLMLKYECFDTGQMKKIMNILVIQAIIDSENQCKEFHTNFGLKFQGTQTPGFCDDDKIKVLSGELKYVDLIKINNFKYHKLLIQNNHVDIDVRLRNLHKTLMQILKEVKQARKTSKK